MQLCIFTLIQDDKIGKGIEIPKIIESTKRAEARDIKHNQKNFVGGWFSTITKTTTLWPRVMGVGAMAVA